MADGRQRSQPARVHLRQGPHGANGRVREVTDGSDFHPGSDIQRVGVVGCGLMGSGIAEVCARAGVDVTVLEIDADALIAGEERIRRSFAKAVKTAKLSEYERDEALDHLSFTTSIGDLAGSQLVIEAVVEEQ